MKKIILLSIVLSSSAFALDFEAEWAKFEKDFEKLRNTPVTETQPSVEVTEEAVTKALPKREEQGKLLAIIR